MKFLNIKFILILSMLFSSALYAKEREHKIRLMGKVKENISKHVSVKDLEKDLKYIEKKVYNPYDKRVNLYGGILFSEFVEKYAKKDVVAVKLIAIDDYTITIDKTDWLSTPILLSTKLNKRYIPIELKGPLMTVFLDYNPKKKEYKDNISKWIWMIKKIEFK